MPLLTVNVALFAKMRWTLTVTRPKMVTSPLTTYQVVVSTQYKFR